MKQALPVLFLIMWCSACGNKTTASEGNFETAINAYYAQHAECIISVPFPYEIQVSGAERTDPKDFDALVTVGLLRREEFTRADTFLGRGTLHYNRYLLTEQGQKVFSPNRWCYGNRKVAKIGKFTEPAEGLGMRVSEVEYTYTLTNVPDWAKNKAVLEAFPDIKKALSGGAPLSGRQALVLTNQGWDVK